MTDVALRGIDAQSGRAIQLHIEEGRLCEVLPSAADWHLPWIAPGFIDLQVNGLAGADFGDPELNRADFERAIAALWRTGTTHCLPTLITASAARLEAALANLAHLRAQGTAGRSILGFHLEGPYISAEDGPRGAHPRADCKDPSWDEFCRWQKAANGGIRLVTLAPERAGAIDFIRRLVPSGVKVAIGHTRASREQLEDAVAAGATLSTHLGNAADDRLQRHHNYILDQLGDDRLWASLIVDGHHLPAHVVRIFVRAKQLDRILLISDAVRYAGLPAGVYDGGHREFEVRADGYVGVVGEPRLAGSGLLLDRGLANLIAFTGCTLCDATRAVTLQPARYLGLEDRLGELQPGREASFVLFRASPEGIVVERTILAGETVYVAST